MGEKKEGDVELHVEKTSGKEYQRGFSEELVAVRNQFMHAVNASANITGITSAAGWSNFYGDLTHRLDSIQRDIREQAKKAQAKEAQERSITHKASRLVLWVIGTVVSTLIAFAIGYLMPH
jgi:hypothetical protein